MKKSKPEKTAKSRESKDLFRDLSTSRQGPDQTTGGITAYDHVWRRLRPSRP